MLARAIELPSCGWKYDNVAAPNTNGTQITSSGANTESSWVQVASAANIAYDVVGFSVTVHGTSASGVARTEVLDIGVDPAGGTSYTAVISNIICGQINSISNRGAVRLFFPLFIKAGSSVAIRVLRQPAASYTTTVAMRFYGQAAALPLLRAGAFSETVGSLTNSIGVSFTPGNASWGSWVQLGTTASRLWWWNVGMQVNNNTIAAQHTRIELAYGDTTNKHTILTQQYHSAGTIEAFGEFGFQTAPWEGGCDVPAGSAIYIRGYCNTTPATGYNACAYGIGG